MRPSLTHLALHVADLDACIRFYQSYCQMSIVHDRISNGHRVVWLAERGREREFILVLLPGGPGRNQIVEDYSHQGFALENRAAVDVVADKARAEGILVWEPVDEPYPVGYYCGVRDPDGNSIEFSYGQPLGPGAEAMNNHFPDLIRSLSRFEGPFDAYQLKTEGCRVLFASYPAGTKIDPHSHDTENCGVITAGELVLITNDIETRYGPGDWYHLLPEKVHAARFEVDTSEIEFWFLR